MIKSLSGVAKAAAKTPGHEPGNMETRDQEGPRQSQPILIVRVRVPAFTYLPRLIHTP